MGVGTLIIAPRHVFRLRRYREPPTHVGGQARPARSPSSVPAQAGADDGRGSRQRMKARPAPKSEPKRVVVVGGRSPAAKRSVATLWEWSVVQTEVCGSGPKPRDDEVIARRSPRRG